MAEVVQNINQTYRPQYAGVSPVRNPLTFSTPVQLADSYRVALVFTPGNSACNLLSSTSEPMESEVSGVEWSLIYLGKVENNANMLLYIRLNTATPVIDYVNFIVPFDTDVKFIIERSQGTIYVFDENGNQIHSQNIGVLQNVTLLYCFFKSPSSDCLCKSLRIFTDTTVQEIINYGALDANKVMSLVIRQSTNLLVDYSLRGLTTSEWQDYSRNSNNLTSVSSLSIKINFPYPQEHSVLQGRNPFISSHQVTPNQYFDYNRTRTGELSSPLMPDGEIKFIRTKISSVLPSDNEGYYQSVDSMVLPENFTMVYHLMFKGTEGKVMELESSPEDTVQVDLLFQQQPDDVNWHQVVVIKDGDNYSLYLDSVLQDTQLAELPVLEIDGTMFVNHNSGNLISIRVFDYPFVFEEIREIYNGSFILSHNMSDDMKSHMIYDFNSEGMEPQSWIDNVKSLSVFSNESLRVLEVPDVQNVDYATIQYPR